MPNQQVATLTNQKPAKQMWQRHNKQQCSCLHMNTENTVSEYFHPCKSLPWTQFSVTWKVIYMCRPKCKDKALF